MKKKKTEFKLSQKLFSQMLHRMTCSFNVAAMFETTHLFSIFKPFPTLTGVYMVTPGWIAQAQQEVPPPPHLSPPSGLQKQHVGGAYSTAFTFSCSLRNWLPWFPAQGVSVFSSCAIISTSPFI